MRGGTITTDSIDIRQVTIITGYSSPVAKMGGAVVLSKEAVALAG